VIFRLHSNHINIVISRE